LRCQVPLAAERDRRRGALLPDDNLELVGNDMGDAVKLVRGDGSPPRGGLLCRGGIDRSPEEASTARPLRRQFRAPCSAVTSNEGYQQRSAGSPIRRMVLDLPYSMMLLGATNARGTHLALPAVRRLSLFPGVRPLQGKARKGRQ
jgi:hypothetical protein